MFVFFFLIVQNVLKKKKITGGGCSEIQIHPPLNTTISCHRLSSLHRGRRPAAKKSTGDGKEQPGVSPTPALHTSSSYSAQTRRRKGQEKGKGTGKTEQREILTKQELVLTGSSISHRFLRGTAPEPFPTTELGECTSSNGTAFSSL